MRVTRYPVLLRYSALLLVMVVVPGIITVFVKFSVPTSLKVPLQTIITVPDDLPDSSADALYILGGSGKSTRRHMQAAINFYRSGITGRILIFGSNTLWEYDPVLRRNLTRNEWEINYLVEGGVERSHIEIVPVKEGFFGTLSEARDLSRYLKKNSYSSVVLVTSPGHTKRVALSLGYYFEKMGITRFIAGSSDRFLFTELIAEVIKLNVYRLIISLDEASRGHLLGAGG